MYKYKWRLTPPTKEEARVSEFWFRRLWISLEEGMEAAQLIDTYQVLVDGESGELMLHGAGETIALPDIKEGEFVEWSPIPEPTGKSVCTDYVILKQEA